jgi:hypothetical protein
MCKIQEVTSGEESMGTECAAVEIGTVWNVCTVEATVEPPQRRPWKIGNHRISPGDLFGKESVGTLRFNSFEALARDEESDDEDEQVQSGKGDGDGESGRDPILKALIGKDRAAAPAAEGPIDEWLNCPPGLNKGGPIQESALTVLTPVKSVDTNLISNHDCVGECCSGGFLDMSKLRKKKRREWRTLRFEDSNDIEICLVENGSVMFGPQQEDNHIWNKATGQKMMLKPKGRGSYAMEVQFVGGEKTSIIVDSGAEESVCPWDWGERLFGTQHSREHMQFKNASGGTIPHWGQREVKVTSTF